MSDEKDKYYNISDAWDDVILGYDAKEKLRQAQNLSASSGSIRFALLEAWA